MLDRIVHLSIRHRWIVLALVLLLSGIGVWSFQRLPIDATPDITNVQVQINTEADGYSPLESEQRLTFPRRQVTQDLLDLGEEPHVQHAIRFVEHQILEMIELGVRRAEVVEQTTRCGDEQCL